MYYLVDKNKEEKKRIQEKLFSLGVLSAGVAHEIGTPLAVIQGRAEMIAQNALSNVRVNESALIISQEVERIKRIVFILLSLGKNQSEIEMAEFPIKMLLEDIFLFFNERIQKGKIQIINEVEFEELVFADKNRFQNVLINLIMNALQAIEKDPDKNNKDKNYIKFCCSQNKKEFKISIEDNGCGIRKEILENIFDPFFTTHDIGEALGLGLPLSYSLCDEMGMELSVESQVGVGSVFYITKRFQESL